MKKISIFFVLFAALVTSLHADVVVEISNDGRQHTVVLDQFDYSYSFSQSFLRGHFFQLTDGSVWEIHELGMESKAFYALRNPAIAVDYVEDFITQWQPGDTLVFHKAIKGEHLLVYNVEQDMLFDVMPFLPPMSDDEYLSVVSIDRDMGEIILSDQSIWEFDTLCKCKNWVEGDPIVVAKNTLSLNGNTHLLVNLKPCRCDATVRHIHANWVEVGRAS